MAVGPLNDLNTVAEPLGDDVNGLAGRHEVTCEASPGVVDGASQPAPTHVCLKGLVEVVSVFRNSLLLLRTDGIALRVPISQEAAEEILKLFG